MSGRSTASDRWLTCLVLALATGVGVAQSASGHASKLSRQDAAVEADRAVPASDSSKTTSSGDTADGPPASDPESSPSVADEAIDAGPSLQERFDQAKSELDRLIATPGTDEAWLRSQRGLVDLLDASLRAQRKLQAFETDVQRAAGEQAAAEARLAAAEGAVERPVDLTLDLAAARQRLLAVEGTVTDLARELSNLEEAADRREVRREQVRTEGADFKDRMASLDGATDETVELREPKRQRIRLETRALEAEIRAYDATDESLRIVQKAVVAELRIARKERDAWQAQVDRLEVDDVQRKLQLAAERAASERDPLLRSVAEENLALAQRLVKATERDTEKSAQLLVRKRLLDRLRRSTEADQRRFADRVTPAIATVLRNRDAALPNPAAILSEVAELQSRLPEIELERLLLEDQLASVRGPTRAAADLLDAQNPPLSETDRADVEPRLVKLLEDQVELYGRPLLKVISLRMEESNELLETNLAVVAEIQRYRSFVLEQTVWVRDATATAPGYWGRVRAQARVFFGAEGWRALLQVMVAEARQRPLLAGGVLVPGFLLIVFARRIRRRIEVAGERVARAETDRFRETLVVTAVDVCFGLAIAAPIWFLGISAERNLGLTDGLRALGNILPVAAAFVFALATLTAVVGRGGLAERHFHWSDTMLRTARRLVVLTWLAIVFGISNRMCDPRQLDLPDLGRLFFSPIPLILMLFLVSVVRNGWDRKLVADASGREDTEKFQPESFLILGGVGILGASLLLVHAGWYEAVSLIQRAVVGSVLYLLVLLVLREVLYRGLYARMRRRTWLLRRQREDGTDTSEETEELQELGDRTTSAIRFCLTVLLLAGLWGIWVDLLPAFQIIRGEELWSYRVQAGTMGGDGISVDQVLVPVTVGDLTLAIALVVGGLYAARNLPTVVELLLLDRVGLERGVKYAVGQLIQWVLIIAGVTAACAMIGITWSSVQWLAAGFTVGLGFGLQEIFANFISGLIILFEQPVRVGDVVTVGQTTGQISRIRMRSTTITDWDRKELVVPNKQFITTEVVNWSIGESCIRLVLPVGVSYDDDPEKVADLLRRLGLDDPGTLSEPEPSVSFKGFGDSSLDFDLRVYLASTDSLVPVRNRLNIAIKKAFDEHGITIPFPQRDMHVSMVRREDPDNGPAAPIVAPPDPKSMVDGAGEDSES